MKPHLVLAHVLALALHPAPAARAEPRVVPLYASAAPAAVAPATSRASTPWWRHWWVWAAVGGATIITITVVAGAAAGSTEDPTLPAASAGTAKITF
jgi:hypothetical protein